MDTPQLDRTFMRKLIVLGGFAFAISEAFLLASTFSSYEGALVIHFTLESVALIAVAYGAVGYILC